MAVGHSFLVAFACVVSLLSGAGADDVAGLPVAKAFLGASAPQTNAVERRASAVAEASTAAESESKDEPKDKPAKEPKQEQPQQQEQEQEGKEEQAEHRGEEEEKKEPGSAPSEGEKCWDQRGNPTNPMLNMILDMAPQCFTLCPKMCSSISEVLGQFSAVPDRSVIQQQVCKYKDVFGCALQQGNKNVCKPVLTPAAGFGVPQSSKDLSRLCGSAAHDTTPEDDDTSSAMTLRGTTVMAGWLLLASAFQHFA